MINYFANRLEEFDPRIRQVLSYPRRNVKTFVQTIQHFAAETTVVTDAFVGRLLVWILLVH